MKVKKSENKEKDEAPAAETEKLSYEDKLQYVTAIAKPMASRKLAKKLFKIVRKSSRYKHHLRSGLKVVQSKIRKGERGIVILAGDVTPIDIICHLPGVCEDLDIPYAYTPSKMDLGEAMGVRRSSIVTMVREHEDYKDLFEECKAEIGKLPLPL